MQNKQAERFIKPPVKSTTVLRFTIIVEYMEWLHKKKDGKWSLRNILILVVVSSIILSNFSVYLGTYSYLSAYLHKDLIEKNELLVNSIANGLQQIVTIPEDVLYEMFAMHYSEELGGSFDKQLQIVHSSHTIVENLIVLDKEGYVESFAPYDEDMLGLDMSRQEFFLRADESPVWFKSLLSPDTGEVTVSVSQRFRDRVYVVDIQLIDLVQAFSIAKTSQGSFQVILDSDGTVLAHHDRNKVVQRENMSMLSELRTLKPGILFTDTVCYGGERYVASFYRLPGVEWTVGFFNNEKDALTPLIRLRRYTFFTLSVSLLITVLIALMLIHSVTRSVNKIRKFTADLGSGNFDTSIPQTRIEEFDILLQQLKTTRAAVKERESELQQLTDDLEDIVHERTHELEDSMRNLKQTQSQLILSEKMAALGGLVAGVAHEINTPIGIGVTAASFIQEQMESIKRDLNNDTLTQEAFESFLEVNIESAELLLSNMKRASDLISSFKKVAVDQQTDKLNEFNLMEYTSEVLRSLTPKLKAGRHKTFIHCDKLIFMKSYPGAFSQILANLVVNSVSHGFEHMFEKEIHITISQKKGQAVIEYCDNGRGIPESVASHIFDPFYTTKRNKGGTGLGMNIVYNLVTQKLGGSIELGVCNMGACFIMTLPLVCGETIQDDRDDANDSSRSQFQNPSTEEF